MLYFIAFQKLQCFTIFFSECLVCGYDYNLNKLWFLWIGYKLQIQGRKKNKKLRNVEVFVIFELLHVFLLRMEVKTNFRINYYKNIFRQSNVKKLRRSSPVGRQFLNETRLETSVLHILDASFLGASVTIVARVLGVPKVQDMLTTLGTVQSLLHIKKVQKFLKKYYLWLLQKFRGESQRHHIIYLVLFIIARQT